MSRGGRVGVGGSTRIVSNRADNDATDMCNPDNFGGPFPLVVLLKQHTFKIESL